MLFLVAKHLAVEFVSKQVDGGVHVVVPGFGMQVFTLEMHCDFGFLLALLNRKNDVCLLAV